jgi:hypothetical protein
LRDGPSGGGGAALAAELSRYEPRDREALLVFRREHYGAGAAQADPAYVDWQFRDAPQIAERGPPLVVARREGRIVGSLGTIRTFLHLKGRALRACWVIDFAVAKELRRAGVGEALGVVSREEGGTRMIIEAAGPARGIAARAHYEPVCEVPLFIRPIHPARWLRSRRVPAALAWVSGAVLPLLATLEARALKAARALGVELVETRAFDERADALFASLSLRYPLLCRRDRAWLEWRYERYPQPGRYRLHWLMRRGEAVGYVVLRSGTHHGVPSGVLVDYLCPPELIPALLGLCIERFRAADAAVASCLHLNPFAAGAFRSLGFLRRSSGWRFLARAGSGADAPLILDEKSWFVTAGDSNVDRDRSPGAPAS